MYDEGCLRGLLLAGFISDVPPEDNQAELDWTSSGQATHSFLLIDRFGNLACRVMADMRRGAVLLKNNYFLF
jgi:hypothetical protein